MAKMVKMAKKSFTVHFRVTLHAQIVVSYRHPTVQSEASNHANRPIIGCACGKKNDVVHTLTCKKGGYVSMRHNSLRDCIANCMREVCHDVRIEPVLLPVDANSFSCSANKAEEARLDISGRGIKSAFERTFMMLG